MPTKTKPRKKYVNPVQAVLTAAKPAEAMWHEVYSIELLHRLVEHNRTKLVPALTLLMEWALDLQLEVNQLDAKLFRQVKPKGGKRVRKSA